MRQCRFCGHINDDALIYCISCDSPLDPTTQSRIPEELRRAIEHNKQRLESPEPSMFLPEDAGITIQGVPASEIFASHPPSAGESASLFDPGQSYEMLSFPVVHQSAEVVSPFLPPNSAQAINPAIPTMIQRSPKPTPVQSSQPQPLPSPGSEYSHLPPVAANPFSVHASDSSPLPSRNHFIPVAPTTEYVAPSPSPSSPMEWVQPLVQVHHQAASEHLHPSASALPQRPKSAPAQKPTPPSVPPSVYQDTSVPQTWESRIDLDNLSSHSHQESEKEYIPGGLRILSSALMLVLMMICGGFVAVFLYMYFFNQTDDLSNPKSKTTQVWKPLESPHHRPRQSPSPLANPGDSSSASMQRLQRVLEKARQNMAEQQWQEAQQKLTLILAAQEASSLHPEATKLSQQIRQEQHAERGLQQAKAFLQDRKWPEMARSLQKITPGTQAHASVRLLFQQMEQRYAIPQLKRSQRFSRRRQYQKARNALQEILQTHPSYAPAQKQWDTLSRVLQRRQKQCLRSCSRIHRKHRRRRNWCQYQCRKRYPQLPSLTQINPSTPGQTSSSTTPQSASPSNSSSSAPNTPTTAASSSSAQQNTCQQRCRRSHTVWQQCQKRHRRRYRYWCQYRCRQRFRGHRKTRCYQTCRQNQYTTQTRKKCRQTHRKYKRCLHSCS